MRVFGARGAGQDADIAGSRRNKALRSIADYRDGFAKQVREVSNRVIEADPVIQLENQATRRSA